MGQSDRSQAISVTDTGTGLGRLGEIAAVFLKLGIFGFGGPVATMAMMEEEAVRARHWITPEEFAEIYAVCKILPGPVSTQMAIYLGRIRGGVRGGVTAGVVFILPCFLMVLGLAILYTETGVVRGAEAVLSGLQAAALSIILISTWGLGKTYRKQLAAWAVVVVSGVLIYLYPRYEPLVILGFGFIGVMQARGGSRAVTALCGGLVAGGLLAGRTAAAAIWAIPSDPSVLLNLFWMCLKAGFLVFGTGLAVVPVLEGEAVRQYHWLTHSQFMDGLAVGQIDAGARGDHFDFHRLSRGSSSGSARRHGRDVPAVFHQCALSGATGLAQIQRYAGCKGVFRIRDPRGHRRDIGHDDQIGPAHLDRLAADHGLHRRARHRGMAQAARVAAHPARGCRRRIARQIIRRVLLWPLHLS